jgi:zinc transport system permease protein
MSFEVLFDPIFRAPFATGLLLSAVLPLVGNYVRLRDEWLAALSLAQVAAAGGLIAVLLGQPTMGGALTAAGTAAVLKGRLAHAGNDNYALLVLLGWGAVFLAAANSAVGPEIAQAFIDGQLYFTGWPQLRTVALVAVLVFVFLSFLSRPLLVERFFPDHFKANQTPAWRYHLSFDVIVAMTLAFGAAMVGVMATFAFVFVPPWIAFRRATGWRNGLFLSVAFSTTGYLAGFVLAILLDQPFGPAQVMVLLILALGARSLEWVQAGIPNRRQT